MLMAFAAWLSKTPLTAFLENAAWAVPAIQTVHILSVAVVFGGAVFINLRVLGLIDTGQPVAVVRRRFLPPLAIAVGVLALTGALLIASEPDRAMFRTLFWIKMALILLVLAATWGQGRLSAGQASAAAAARRVDLALAVVIVALWVAVIFAGRWIGYVSGWPGSPT